MKQLTVEQRYGTLLQEAHAIINSWKKDELTLEQVEIIEELGNLEENEYPFIEIIE